MRPLAACEDLPEREARPSERREVDDVSRRQFQPRPTTDFLTINVCAVGSTELHSLGDRRTRIPFTLQRRDGQVRAAHSSVVDDEVTISSPAEGERSARWQRPHRAQAAVHELPSTLVMLSMHRKTWHGLGVAATLSCCQLRRLQRTTASVERLGRTTLSVLQIRGPARPLGHGLRLAGGANNGGRPFGQVSAELEADAAAPRGKAYDVADAKALPRAARELAAIHESPIRTAQILQLDTTGLAFTAADAGGRDHAMLPAHRRFADDDVASGIAAEGQRSATS
mmetsp:Transcript_56994/g.158685  ORF Transcript_56994/g.158685 Transcript_56994/m.158685 type:complete len:283 (+) Transcript_56994:494-1342(+)